MISTQHSEPDQIVHRLKEIIAEIPHGSVATVDELVEALKLTADRENEIVWALKGINDDTVPTWRVVRNDGSLLTTTAAGNWEAQKQQLQAEGVAFVTEDKVDVKAHFWSAVEFARPE